jgi:hypothetical protein
MSTEPYECISSMLALRLPSVLTMLALDLTSMLPVPAVFVEHTYEYSSSHTVLAICSAARSATEGMRHARCVPRGYSGGNGSLDGRRDEESS